MTANQINYAKLQEDIRHNLVTEGESYRHNVEDEKIRSDTNAINMANYEESVRHNVQTEAINAEHYYRMDAETARSHLANEAETIRSNMAKEAEIYRSNVATEELRASELEEDIRHNKAVEKETKRHNKAEEGIGKRQAGSAELQAEVAARNADTRYLEYLTEKDYRQRQVAYWNGQLIVSQAELDEKIRYDTGVLDETNRHNTSTESIQWQATQNDFIATPTADVRAAKEKAAATESLARAGYLKTQDDWYAWNQIVNTAVSVSQAVKNFMSPITIIKGGK